MATEREGGISGCMGNLGCAIVLILLIAVIFHTQVVELIHALKGR